MHPRAAGQVILDVTDLQVSAVTAHKPLSIVRGVSLQVGAGEIFGLLGESGSGKSMTVQAINGLLPAGARVTGGSVKFNGEELIGASQRRLSQLRGQHIGMVFQEFTLLAEPDYADRAPGRRATAAPSQSEPDRSTSDRRRASAGDGHSRCRRGDAPFSA